MFADCFIQHCSLFSSRHCALVACDAQWLTITFHSMFWISSEVVYLQCCLVVAWLVPRETAAVLAHVLCTPYSHAPVYSVTSFKATYIRCIHVCLAVTHHMHFWQNGRNLLHATVVTRGVEQIWKVERRVSTETFHCCLRLRSANYCW